MGVLANSPVLANADAIGRLLDLAMDITPPAYVQVIDHYNNL